MNAFEEIHYKFLKQFLCNIYINTVIIKYRYVIHISTTKRINLVHAHKAWFPHGRKRVVTVVEIGLQSISTIVTTRLTTIWRPGLMKQRKSLQFRLYRYVSGTITRFQ